MSYHSPENSPKIGKNEEKQPAGEELDPAAGDFDGALDWWGKVHQR